MEIQRLKSELYSLQGVQESPLLSRKRSFDRSTSVGSVSSAVHEAVDSTSSLPVPLAAAASGGNSNTGTGTYLYLPTIIGSWKLIDHVLFILHLRTLLHVYMYTVCMHVHTQVNGVNPCLMS